MTHALLHTLVQAGIEERTRERRVRDRHELGLLHIPRVDAAATEGPSLR